jgi:hypothetical protein
MLQQEEAEQQQPEQLFDTFLPFFIHPGCLGMGYPE